MLLDIPVFLRVKARITNLLRKKKTGPRPEAVTSGGGFFVSMNSKWQALTVVELYRTIEAD